MEKPLTGTHVSGDMLGPGKGGLAYWTLGEGVSSLWTTAARGAGDGTDLVVASHGDDKSSADDVEDGDEGVLEDELLVSERECERRLSFFTQPCTYRVRIAMTSLLQCFFSHLLLCILSQKIPFSLI